MKRQLEKSLVALQAKWRGTLTRSRSDLALKKQGTFRSSGAGSRQQKTLWKLPRNETDNLTHSQPVVLDFSTGSTGSCVRAEKSCYRFNALRYISIYNPSVCADWRVGLGWFGFDSEKGLLAFGFGFYRSPVSLWLADWLTDVLVFACQSCPLTVFLSLLPFRTAKAFD